MSEENKGATAIEVTLAFLLGGMVGAGLALLFAPATGVETRRKLRETSGKIRDRIRDGTDRWKETVAESGDRAAESVKGFVDDKRTRAQAAYSAAKDAWQNPKDEKEA